MGSGVRGRSPDCLHYHLAEKQRLYCSTTSTSLPFRPAYYCSVCYLRQFTGLNLESHYVHILLIEGQWLTRPIKTSSYILHTSNLVQRGYDSRYLDIPFGFSNSAASLPHFLVLGCLSFSVLVVKNKMIHKTSILYTGYSSLRREDCVQSGVPSCLLSSLPFVMLSYHHCWFSPRAHGGYFACFLRRGFACIFLHHLYLSFSLRWLWLWLWHPRVFSGLFCRLFLLRVFLWFAVLCGFALVSSEQAGEGSLVAYVDIHCTI